MDELLFLRSRPLLQLVLAPERVGQRRAGLRVHQAHRTAPARVFRTPAAVVQAESSLRVPRPTCIQRPVPAADDVDEMSSHRLLPQQHVDRASATICPRGIRIGQHGRMAPEIVPHTRLEDRHVPLGMQPPAVDDADASVAMAPAGNELLHVRDGFLGGLGVQVEPAAWSVVSALDRSELTPIDTRRDVTLLRSRPIVITC